MADARWVRAGSSLGASPAGRRRGALRRLDRGTGRNGRDGRHGRASGATTLTYPVPAGDGVTIDKKEQIILVRYQQKLYAFPLACPHENTALRWRQGDLRFQCPRHDSKYRPDGAFMTGRATRNMDRYAVSRNGGSVVVDLTKLYQSDTQAAQWATASAPA